MASNPAFPVHSKTVLTLALSAALLSGCSWFGSKSNAPQPAALATIPAGEAGRVAWQASVGSAGRFVFTPGVTRTALYVAAQDGTVVRIDPATGSTVGRFSAGQPIAGGVGASEQLVLVGTDKGEVIALEPQGGVRWKSNLPSEVLVAPVETGGVVVARTVDGKISGLDAKDGKLKWQFERTMPALTLRKVSPMVVDGGVVYAGLPGGKLVAINAADGGVRWEATVALPKGGTELERVADVIGAPALQGQQLCALAYQGKVSCMDTRSGASIWSRELPGNGGVDMDHTAVFAVDDKGGVSAYDRASGRNLWKQDKLFMRGVSGPAALGRFVAVGDYQGYVHIMNREDGSFVGRVATDGSPILAQPIALNERIVVQTRNGNVFGIALQ